MRYLSASKLTTLLWISSCSCHNSEKAVSEPHVRTTNVDQIRCGDEHVRFQDGQFVHELVVELTDRGDDAERVRAALFAAAPRHGVRDAAHLAHVHSAH